MLLKFLPAAKFHLRTTLRCFHSANTYYVRSEGIQRRLTSSLLLRDTLHAVNPDSRRIQMMKNYYTLCVSARKRDRKKLTLKVFKMQLFAMMFLAAPHGLFSFSAFNGVMLVGAAAYGFRSRCSLHYAFKTVLFYHYWKGDR